MKKIQKPKTVLNTTLKYLTVAVATAITMPAAQSDVSGKEIGDLEIYQPAEGGRVTITMMLDTSGSMLVEAVGSDACDLSLKSGGAIAYNGNQRIRSKTTPAYDRYMCKVDNVNKRIYSSIYVPYLNTHYPCTQDGKCNYQSAKTGRPSNYNSSSKETYTNFQIGNYIYPTVEKFYTTAPLTNEDKKEIEIIDGVAYKPDRMTRLKDAMFALMDSPDLGSNNVSIGIGQFSSSSDSNNRATQADGFTGKIVVPAGLLTQEHRAKIKQEVANLGGGNSTPAAQAYAEAGAYMLGTSTKNPGTFVSSGRTVNIPSGFDKSVASSKRGDNYISPIPENPASCDGQGIYFLTDGEPNNSGAPERLMAKVLGGRTLDISANNTLPNGTQFGNGTQAVGAFAKILRDANTNPKKISMRTAVVGFGSVFNTEQYPNIKRELAKPELDKDTSLPKVNGKLNETEVATYFDCSLITGSIDAQNACNWGAKSHPQFAKEGKKVGGYGEGGFYSAQSTQDVIDSVKTFLGDLSNSIDPVPAGVIVVPNDPYSLSNKQAVAYYPVVEANVSESIPVWPGNMKKYALDDGTLFGKSNAKLFKNLAGDLNPQAQDLWSDKDYTDKNNAIDAGGFYAQLKTPKSGLSSVRKLYIQDENKLKSFGVNAQGKVTVDDKPIGADNALKDAVYTQEVKKKLLNFLGFTDLPAHDVEDAKFVLSAPAEETKILGASIHSSPAVVSHGADLDDNGRVKDERPNDYVLFGSMDGALHLVRASNYGQNNGGQERFAFIPQEMLKGQNLQGLSKTGTGKAIGVPNFGIDAPWLVATDYRYDLQNKKVTIDKQDGIGMYAYGGLRMGGKALYGLNLEDVNNPKFAFEITPATKDFERMGQIWSKPVRAKIKQSTTDTKGTEVLIFGGGYDMCYENEKFQVGVTDATALGACSGKTEAEGNAVYIINAKTGKLIWSASNNTGKTKHSDLKHSIVGEINVLDRDNDGFMDHIYFADLGGQVFRADFKNAGLKIGENETTTFTNARIVKLLANANSGDNQKFNRRFYEKPVISVYRNEVNNRLFAMVNVISGDRSSPLSKYRQDDKYADRVYGLMDFDVALPARTFYADDFNNSFGTGVVDDNLINIPAELASKKDKAAVKRLIENQNKDGKVINGWYYPLTRFDGYANVKYTKGVGRSEVIGSMLYTTVYNPDKDYNGATSSCSAKIAGGSERQLYCLPYGICSDDTSINGTGGFVPAGRGIQELTLGPLGSTEDKRNKTVLIGNQTITEQQDVTNNVAYGKDPNKEVGLENIQKQAGNTAITQEGGDGSAAIFLYNERFQLKPKTWYEVN